jgi:hypothetical protein
MRCNQRAAGAPSMTRWSKVEGQAKGHHILDGKLAVPDDRFFDDATDSENCGLWQVEDRREGVDAVHSKIGDRERAARELILAELAAARLGDQLPRAICYLMKREAVDIAYDRSK